MWTNFRQLGSIYPLCLKMHLEALKWQRCIILIHGLCIVLLLFCTRLWKHLFHCFLMFTSCIPCFGIILYPFNCSAFQSQLRAFLILHHNCYSVSSDKGYKERNKLVVILLPCLFFDGSSFLFFCMWQSDVCRQYCVLVGSAVAQTSLQQPVSAAVTNGKWEWHLSILTSHAQNLLNHINAKWKRVASKAQYCNRKKNLAVTHLCNMLASWSRIV